MGFFNNSDGVTQSVHNSLNCNANMQINDVDVSQTNKVLVSSQASISSASVTRGNDTNIYAINDVVGATPTAVNHVFENVYPVSGANIIINRVELRIDTAAIPSGMYAFRLHLYDTAPTPILDNAPFNLPSTDRVKYLGFIDISDSPIDFGDTIYIDMKGVNFQCKLATASTTLYGQLVTLNAYTPTASIVKTIKLHSLGV